MTQARARPDSAAADERLDRAEQLLGHRFSRPTLLREALTHRSAASGRMAGRRRAAARNGSGSPTRSGAESPTRSGAGSPPRNGAGSNERLEFIGDRVLGLVMAEWVAERFPAEQEGELGPRHAHLVSREAVCAVAERIGLAAVLSLGTNEAMAGVGRLATVLADAMEAAIGALYLDGGLAIAQRFVREAWEPAMQAMVTPPKDPKTALQERLLSRGEALPEYRVISSLGPSHAPRFVIEVTARGHTGMGEGGTKRLAERSAAADLLGKIGLGKVG